MSRDAFERHMRQTHFPLLAKVPGLRRLVINWALPDPHGAPPACDAVAEDWFDNDAAMNTALASAQMQAVVADAPNFLDMSRLKLMVVQEEEAALPSAT
jgi:uncharacterized protein (TIGR02118 family)